MTIKQRIAVFLVLASWCASALAAPEEVALKNVLEAYEQAWSQHDAIAIASFYHEPAMRIGRGGPVVRPTRADQEAFFSHFVPELVQRGFDHSEFEELNVHLLDADTAIASGILLRYRKDGSLMERIAVTYGLRKGEQGWKIFLSDTHSPETAMRFR